MAAHGQVEYLELYHRTSPEAAETIMRERSMLSKENTAEVYLSNRTCGVTDGYGPAVVQLRIPEELAELEDEFPDGEQHYRVRADALRAEHFVRTWTEKPDAPHDDLRGPAAHPTEQAPEHPDPTVNIGPIETDDPAGITAPNQPAATEPGPPQVDLDLGEAVYRQAAGRGGFTPESVAGAEVTIEQAATRQSTTNAARLHALANQVETSAASRGPAPTASGITAPAPAAPPPRVEVARARAASAQIWDETRDEYDPRRPRPNGADDLEPNGLARSRDRKGSGHQSFGH